jgi:arylsulfatase A
MPSTRRLLALLPSFGVAFALAAASPAQGAPTTKAARAKPPNFVFVQFEATGIGWSSTSVAMDDRRPDAKSAPERTPHLAALAAQGMRLSSFYVTAPRCTPARASFLTGVGAAKLHMTYVSEGGQERRGGEDAAGGRRGGQGGGRDAAAESATTKLIPPACTTELPAETTTIAEVLRGAGYRSAHFGKWHVGRAAPAAHGFDEHDGANSNQGPGRDPQPNPEQGTMITDRGLAFAKAQAAAGTPFYLQLSHYGGGSEDESRPESRQALAAELRGLRGKSAWQVAILHDLDRELGRLLAGLAELGLADRTYVIVSCDHGASGRAANAPLRGGKGSVLEGGVRVPFVVRGPGIAAGACSHVRASACDLLPTLADLAGIAAWPTDVEGGSLAAVWRGGGAGSVRRPREEFVVHFPHYDLQNGGPASAIYLDEWKLIRSYETGAVQLFDLDADPEERVDRAAAKPKVVSDLTRRLDAYLQAIDAGMPRPAATAPPAGGK